MALTACKGVLSTARPHFVYCQRTMLVVLPGVWPGGGFVWPCPQDISISKMLLDKMDTRSKFVLRAILLYSAEATPWLDGAAQATSF